MCPDGKVAIGGGAETLPQANWTANPVHNGPTNLTQAADGTWSGDEWTVTVDAEKVAGGGNATLKTYVICATP